MSVQAAAIVLAWVAIVMLAAALAACVRALRFHEARLAQVASQPRRLAPGDRIRPPDGLRGEVTGHEVLLLFVKSDCRSCLDAVRRVGTLASAAPGRLRVVALWRGAAPAGMPDDGVLSHREHEAQAFEELRVGLLPTAVFARHGRVLAAGAVGSPSAVEELWASVLEHASGEGGADASRGPAGTGPAPTGEPEGIGREEHR